MMEVEGVVGGIEAGGNGDDVAWVAKEVTLALLGGKVKMLSTYVTSCSRAQWRTTTNFRKTSWKLEALASGRSLEADLVDAIAWDGLISMPNHEAAAAGGMSRGRCGHFAMGNG
jgi:hypothetical protein